MIHTYVRTVDSYVGAYVLSVDSYVGTTSVSSQWMAIIRDTIWVMVWVTIWIIKMSFWGWVI